VPLLAQGTRSETLWLLADFRLPATGWRRLRTRAILAALYLFFKISTSLSANQLTPPDKFLQATGFTLAERRRFDLGLVHSDVWRKNKREPHAGSNL
jgi:tRNA (cmo5U34)-methyltransferase